MLQGGFRLSLVEDGRMIVHQPQMTTNTLTQVIRNIILFVTMNVNTDSPFLPKLCNTPRYKLCIPHLTLFLLISDTNCIHGLYYSQRMCQFITLNFILPFCILMQ